MGKVKELAIELEEQRIAEETARAARKPKPASITPPPKMPTLGGYRLRYKDEEQTVFAYSLSEACAAFIRRSKNRRANPKKIKLLYSWTVAQKKGK